MEEKHLTYEISNLKEEIICLKNSVNNLTKIVESLNTRTTNHIDFIENVYNGLKYPLHYIKTRIEYITGASRHIE
jgi:hypothetical protein